MPKVNFKRAFTLIELLVVMGIIGVLAGAIMYSTGNARQKGRDSQRKTSLEAFRTAAVSYFADNKVYPDLCVLDTEPNPDALPSCEIVTSGGQNWRVVDSAANPTAWQNAPGFSQYFQDGKVPLDVNQLTSAIPTKLASLTSKLASWFTTSSTNSNQNGQVAGTATATYQIAAGRDDGKRVNYNDATPDKYEYTIRNNPQGTAYECAGTQRAIRDNYFRFSNINIPKDATIDSATLTITPQNNAGVSFDDPIQNGENLPVGASNFRSVIKAEQHLDAPQITDTDNGAPTNFNSKVTALSGAPSVTWDNPGRWNPLTGGANVSPDIKTLIQPIVNQSAWDATNRHISLFWLDNGTTPGCTSVVKPTLGIGRAGVAYEGQQAGDGAAPVLTITYTTPDPIIVSCEAEATGSNITNTPGSGGSFIETGEPVTASNSAYISSNASDNSGASESVGPVNGSANGGVGGSIQYKVYPPTAGTYYFFARVKYPPTVSSHNTFWMQINGSGPSGSTSFYKVGNDSTTGWHWINFRNGDTTSDVISAALTSGENTVKIWSREDGTQIDKFELKTDSSLPINNGDNSGNCSGGTTATATLTASPSTIDSGQTSTLTWSSTNASSCGITPGTWPTTTSGSQASTALSGTTIFTLTCDTASDSETVTVNQGEDPPTGGGPTGDSKCENSCKTVYQLCENKKCFKLWVFLENENDSNRADGPSSTGTGPQRAGPNAVCTGSDAELTAINPEHKPLYCIESPPI